MGLFLIALPLVAVEMLLAFLFTRTPPDSLRWLSLVLCSISIFLLWVSTLESSGLLLFEDGTQDHLLD